MVRRRFLNNDCLMLDDFHAAIILNLMYIFYRKFSIHNKILSKSIHKLIMPERRIQLKFNIFFFTNV